MPPPVFFELFFPLEVLNIVLVLIFVFMSPDITADKPPVPAITQSARRVAKAKFETVISQLCMAMDALATAARDMDLDSDMEADEWEPIARPPTAALPSQRLGQLRGMVHPTGTRAGTSPMQHPGQQPIQRPLCPIEPVPIQEDSSSSDEDIASMEGLAPLAVLTRLRARDLLTSRDFSKRLSQIRAFSVINTRMTSR